MTRAHLHQAGSTTQVGMTPLVWCNAMLAVCAALALLYYVTAANGLAAQAWRLSDAREKVDTLQEERNGLIAQQSSFEDRAKLSSLAVGAGMVPAGTVVYLVQERPVAAR